jgi:hypothetical protein
MLAPSATLGITLTLQESVASGSTACLLALVDFRGNSPRGLCPRPEAGVSIQADCRIGAVIVVGPLGMGLNVEDWLYFRSRTGCGEGSFVICGYCTKAQPTK